MGVFCVAMQINMGFAMIMMMRSLESMFDSVINFEPMLHNKKQQIWFGLLCAVFDVPILVGWFTYKTNPDKTSKLANDYVILVFMILFILLSYMTLQVTKKIDEIQPRVQSGSMTLIHQKRALIIVLFCFDLGYLARFILSATIYRKAYAGEYSNPFVTRMATEAPAIFVDALPIFLVLCIHHQTFSNKAETNQEIHDLVMSEDENDEFS